VRELENFIERAVILSPGADLHVPLSELKPLTGNSTNGAKTLEGIEREHILKILRQTNWIIGGRGGSCDATRYATLNPSIPDEKAGHRSPK
jgi:formate hydrogenlyase transcriptional activator